MLDQSSVSSVSGAQTVFIHPCMMKLSMKDHLWPKQRFRILMSRGGQYGKNIISRFYVDSLSCCFYYFV